MKILIIDDMEEVIGTIRNIILDEIECEITTASNGKEGIEKIQAENPDVVITDTDMPIKNGIEVIRFIKRNALGMKVILKSASKDNKKLADREGVAFYFLGDFDKIIDLVKGE
jgi:YesN/AraC family two-component response regulator